MKDGKRRMTEEDEDVKDIVELKAERRMEA